MIYLVSILISIIVLCIVLCHLMKDTFENSRDTNRHTTRDTNRDTFTVYVTPIVNQDIIRSISPSFVVIEYGNDDPRDTLNDYWFRIRMTQQEAVAFARVLIPLGMANDAVIKFQNNYGFSGAKIYA